MKMPLKIWLLAIAYQTIIFAFLFHAGFWIYMIVPIEFIGGIPGLFIFYTTLNNIINSNNTLIQKWVNTTISAFFSAALTSALTLLFFFAMFEKGLSPEKFILIIPSVIAAVLSLFTFYMPVNKLLKQQAIQLTQQDKPTDVQQS